MISSAILQKRSFRISIEIPDNNSLKDARWVHTGNFFKNLWVLIIKRLMLVGVLFGQAEVPFWLANLADK